jgi:hypothetical protein
VGKLGGKIGHAGEKRSAISAEQEGKNSRVPLPIAGLLRKIA